MRFSDTEHVRQNLRKRSVHGVLHLATGQAGEFVLRLVSVSILARLLVPEHFGLIGMVTAITAIAAQVSHLGLSAATVQCKEISHQQVTNLFWINVAFGLLLTLIICALSPLIVAFYGDPRLLPITMILATSFFWGGLTVQHEALLTRQMKQGQSAYVRLSSSLISITLSIYLAVHGFGYWALVCQEVIRNFLIAVGIWICCPWMPGVPRRRTDMGSLLRFGRDITLMQFLNALIQNLDRLLLGRYLGPAAVGLYRQAQQLIMAPIDQLNFPIQDVSQPGLSVLQDSPERYRRYYHKILLVVGLLTMPIAAFAFVYAHEITHLVLGDNWAEAAPALAIFAMAAFIRPVLGTTNVVLVTCGKTKRALNFSIVRNITLVVFTIIGVRWGLLGVAWAQLANTAILTLPCLFFSFADTPVSVGGFFSAIKTPVTGCILMVGGLLAFRAELPIANSILSTLAGFSVGMVIYVLACLLVPGSRREMHGLVTEVAPSIPGLRHLLERYTRRRAAKPAPPEEENTPVPASKTNLRNMRIVAPFGFYGWGNTGDEATLNGFGRLLEMTGCRAQVSAGSRNPGHTAVAEPSLRYFDASRRDPRRWWAKKRASAQVVIGGTPIQDVLGDWPLEELTPLLQAADAKKIPFAFVGVGVEGLRSKLRRRRFTREIAPRVKHWSVRSHLDADRLVRYGVAPEAITVAADMAWLIEPATADFGETHLSQLGIDPYKRLIGINVVNENAIFDRQPEVAAALAKALDQWVEEHDAHLVFIAQDIRTGENFDLAATNKIIRRLKRKDRAVIVPNHYFTPRQLMSIIDCCAFTISMRYHFCILSAIQGVPFLALERSDKVSDLCSDLQWRARVQPKAQKSHSAQTIASELISHGRHLIQDAASLKEQLSRSTELMKQRALLNKTALDALQA